MNCETCRFWNRESKIASGSTISQLYHPCQRHAPTVEGIKTCRWPITRNDQWCGDYQETISAERPN